MNVIRDRDILGLDGKQYFVALKAQLQASEERLKLGEDTRTDVSQARARLALSRAALARAGFRPGVARWHYFSRHRPGSRTCATHPCRRPAPPSLDAALAIADRGNPNVLAAAFNEEAARHNIDLVPASSSRRCRSTPICPQSAAKRWRRLESGGRRLRADRHADLRGWPGLFTDPRGQQTASQRALKISISAARSRAGHRVVEFAARGDSDDPCRQGSGRSQQDGARRRSAGNARRQPDGLDVLDAEQELVDLQVLLATAERDRIIAGYQLIASVGRRRRAISIWTSCPTTRLGIAIPAASSSGRMSKLSIEVADPGPPARPPDHRPRAVA